MSTQYSLVATNNSAQFQDLCVYLKPYDLGVPNVVPLAWQCAPAWPKTTVTFTWTLDYSFVWARTSSLKPGMLFDTEDVVAADPHNVASNDIQFDYRQGAFGFLPGSGGTTPLGSLSVRELAGVPVDTAAVGIGMSGIATFAAPAEPNMLAIFTPHLSYWITAGVYTRGQVLDVEEIANEAEVPFEEGVFAMRATLNPDNTWTVSAVG